MTNTNMSREIEALAAEIGERIYIDVAKWHVYLGDVHHDGDKRLHTLLAERFYPMLEEAEFDADRMTSVLQDISIPLGGGKRSLSLAEVIPTSCERQLTDLLEDFQRQM